jgi:hypothetical protein
MCTQHLCSPMAQEWKESKQKCSLLFWPGSHSQRKTGTPAHCNGWQPGHAHAYLVGRIAWYGSLATHMMKKEMERIDMPDVHEFLDILKASGVKALGLQISHGHVPL